jgi:hypothetical protein
MIFYAECICADTDEPPTPGALYMNGRCYLSVEKPMNYVDAVNNCLDKNGWPLSAKTAQEAETAHYFFKGYFLAIFYYINIILLCLQFKLNVGDSWVGVRNPNSKRCWSTTNCTNQFLWYEDDTPLSSAHLDSSYGEVSMGMVGTYKYEKDVNLT